MDWDKLRIFHAVADAGSLTHAGDTLHLSQSAVSRQIRALEESLDTTLFRRHARGLLLTEQGELLFEATRTMTKRLEATAARIRDSEDEVFGELRVTTTTGFGTLWLAPRLHAAVRALSEPEDRPDARGAHPRPADARGRRGDPAEGAEPGRADPAPADGGAHPPLRQPAPTSAKHGLPATPEELAGHRLITQSPASPQVRAGADFVQPLPRRGAVLVADGQQLLRHPAGRDPRPRHRLAARLPDRRLPRPGQHPAGRAERVRSRPTSPMSRNCGIPSGYARFAISCSRRSRAFKREGEVAERRPRHEPCSGAI